MKAKTLSLVLQIINTGVRVFSRADNTQPDLKCAFRVVQDVSDCISQLHAFYCWLAASSSCAQLKASKLPRRLGTTSKSDVVAANFSIVT